MADLTVGLLLFPSFEVLDMAGPIQCLNVLSVYMEKKLTLYVIAETMDAIAPGSRTGSTASTFAGQQLYLPTHTIHNVPTGLDVLLVPGGVGAADKENTQAIVEFIKRVYNGYDGFGPASYVFSVCNGAMLLAWAGILDGELATTNKMYWQRITEQGPKTHWLAKARWVVSNRIWTTSGVTAGIDGMLAFIAKIYDEDTANKVSATIEHTRAQSSDQDPWAEAYACQDVLPVQATSV